MTLIRLQIDNVEDLYPDDHVSTVGDAAIAFHKHAGLTGWAEVEVLADDGTWYEIATDGSTAEITQTTPPDA